MPKKYLDKNNKNEKKIEIKNKIIEDDYFPSEYHLKPFKNEIIAIENRLADLGTEKKIVIINLNF